MITARWGMCLLVECPHCDQEFDILDLPDSGDILQGVQIAEAGVELSLTCPECGENFEAKTVY